MTNFPEGTHILLGAVPPIELHQLSNVFLPVDGMEHLDHLWRGYRRVKGVAPTGPGLDTHITAQFVDPNVDDHPYNLSNDTYMAVVVSDTGGPISFAPGIRILAGAVTIADILKFNMNVFLPMGNTEYRGHTWEKIALTKTFHLQGSDVTVEFATPDVPPKTYSTDTLTNAMLAVWETGQVIAGLAKG
jgi:hypothetical protein